MNWLFEHTPLKFFAQSFWRDEAFSYLLAKRNIIEMITLTAKDYNPPFYYILLNIWMHIFGTSEIALRSLSLVFYWATLYVMFDFMHDMLKISYKRCVMYLLIFIINPILGYYAFEARMYTMLAFFAVASWYCFMRPYKRLYMVTAVLGLYTHYFMVFVLITQALWLLIPRRTHKRPEAHEHPVRPWLTLMGKVAMMFLPWIILVAINHRTDDGEFWIGKVKPRDFILLPGIMYTGMETFLDYFYKKEPVYLFSMVSISMVIGTILVNGYRRVPHKKIYHALLLWAFFPVIVVFFISFFRSYFLPRYLIFTSVGLLLAIAYALEHIRKNARIILIALLVLLTMHHVSLQVKYRGKENLAATFTEIKNLADEDDVLYVTDVLDFHPAQYYFGEKNVYLYTVVYEEIPSFVGRIIIPEDRVRYGPPQFPQKAFILKKDHSYDIMSGY